jgi:sirohydrochlorin ferrochelatase
MERNADTFPRVIGTSPAGVEYVARKPEDVAKLEVSLERQWMRARKVESLRIKLSAGAIEAIRRADTDTMPKGRLGSVFVEGSREFLDWCADSLRMRIEDLEANGADEMAEHYFGVSNRDKFFEAANARRVRALRKQLAKLER